MPDGSENIGGIDVSVGLDYSDVAADFATIQDQAQGAGEGIAEAFNSGAGGVTTFDEAVQSAAGSVYACTQETLDQIAALQAAGEAEDAAAAKAKEEAAAQNEAANAAAESAEKHGELLKTLLEFAGITVGIDALKEFAEGSIEAAASTEKATIALGALRGNSEAAGEQIEDLKATAQQFAVPFESLVGINQRFAALGLTVAESRDAMHSAIEAAAAMNTSVDNAANAIDRMVLSGTAGTRQLLALGLSTSDLARAMGVATDETKKAFAALDQEQRLETINTALKKFGDTAEQTAAGMEGSWTKLKNATVFAMEGIGNAIGPVAAKFADLATGVLNLLTGLDGTQKAIADSEKDWQLLAVEADRAGISHKELDQQFNQLLISADNYTARLRSLIEEQGKVAPETSKATDATSLYGAALADSQAKLAKVTAEYQAGKATAEELLSAQSQLAAAQGAYNDKIAAGAVSQEYANRQIKEFAPPVTAAAAGMDLYSAAAEGANARQEALQLGLGMAGERLEQAAASYNRASQTGVGYVEALNGLVAAQKAYDKAAKEAGATQEAWDEAVATAPSLAPQMDASAKATKAALDSLNEFVPALDNPIKPAQTLDEAFKALRLTVDDTTGDVGTKMVQAFDTVAASGKATTQQLDAAWSQVSGAVSKLAKTDLPEAVHQQQIYVDALAATDPPAQKLIAAEQALLKDEIALAQERGQSADKYMIELANLNEQTKILNDTTNIWGRAYTSVTVDIDKAFSSLGSNISAGIMQGENFSKIWQTIWKGFAQEILNVAITAIEQWAEKYLISAGIIHTATAATTAAQTAAHTATMAQKAAETTATATLAAAQKADSAALIAQMGAEEAGLGTLGTAWGTFDASRLAGIASLKAAETVADVGEVSGAAGIAGAFGFASVMEALPFPANVAVAPAVAAASAAEVLGAFVPMASFAGGIDYVPYDMVAQIHQGERIVTAAENSSTTNNSNPVTVQIIVQADRNPQETARQLARHLTRLSPVFSPLGAGV
jgi:hypothetical protein